MPFPYQFHQALFGIYEYKDKPFPSPFSKPWIAAWTNLSMVIGSKQSPTKCKSFFPSDGYRALKSLAARGCDPNLVMSLFVQYLWDERAPSFDSKDINIQGHRESLKAIKLTRGLWQSHTWQKTTETEFVNNALRQLEDIVQSYVDERDFHGGRHSQNAKQNRVIYAIYKHLDQRSTGPQWRLFLNLLVAAGAIAADFSASTQPDRRIMPRIKVFERDHPKEAKLIPDCVRSWPLSHFPYPASALPSARRALGLR